MFHALRDSAPPGGATLLRQPPPPRGGPGHAGLRGIAPHGGLRPDRGRQLAGLVQPVEPGRRPVSAYLTCLRQLGVNVPAARPATAPAARPTARPSGFGAGNATVQKARQACASLRPGGGFGSGGGGFAAAFQAFRSCMASHGVTIPTTRPTAPPASGAPRAGRFLHGLNPSDPQVAAALKACQSKLPAFTRPPGGASAAAA
jgi:hypothetical protein